MRASLFCNAPTSENVSTIHEALLSRHNGQSSQYSSERHRRALDQCGTVHQKSRRGKCWDNATMDSVFKALKVKRVRRLSYETRAEVRLDIVNWTEEFYNRRQRH